MKKKFIVCMLLILAMLVQLAGCGQGSQPSNVGESTGNGDEGQVSSNGGAGEVPGYSVTTEDITLRYWHTEDEKTMELMAEKFMDIYPNIKVECRLLSSSPASDMTSAASTGEFPDAFQFTDIDTALINLYWGDMTEYWNADPENQNLMPTINEYGIGCFETGHRFAAPSMFWPCTVYIDRAVIEKLNLEMPRLDWTWSEMIQLIKDATVDDGTGMKYFGLGYYNRLDSLYGIAAAAADERLIKGEFGFNGTDFDLSYWAIGETEFGNLKIDGYVAPTNNSTEVAEHEKMEAWMGDYNGWFGTTGHVAVISEAFWTYMNLWAIDGYQEQYGLDIVPYTVPRVVENETEHNVISEFRMAGISSSTKHPYEAYLLLKFMSWGVDGWKARLDIYEDETIVNAANLPLKNASMPMPLTLDEEVWARYKALFPDYEEDKEYWDTFFASVTRPVPFGWESIAGYWNACAEYFNSIGIHDLVDQGRANAADYAPEATQKFNYYHADAMLTYFGPDGYDVLSDEDIALYESMKEAASK